MYTNLKMIGIYFLLFFGAAVGIHLFVFPDLLALNNFLYWDAEHYIFIKDNGYLGRRVAFFPLFPLIWRGLNFNAHWISILNGLVFLSSFMVLLHQLKVEKKEEVLLYTSIPSFVFFFLPYSESFFFLAATAICIGFIKHQQKLIYLGLFLSVLTRPAFVILIPSFFVVTLITGMKNTQYKVFLFYGIITLIGICIVGLIQYNDTGEWFQFFEAQKHWSNELQLPRFPLRSWGHGYAVGLDGMAFLLGTISGMALLGYLLGIKRIKRLAIQPVYIFALSYLAGISLLVLLYRGGLLFSLNRFVFATPFVILAIHFWLKLELFLTVKHLGVIFCTIWFYWLLFESYIDLYQLTKFTLLSLYALLIFAIKSDKITIRKLSYYMFIVLNFSFQLISFVGFLKEKWIA